MAQPLLPRLFAPDPIDLADPSPYAALPYYAHIAIGLVAFAAAFIAFWAVKGGRLHVKAGWVYLAAIGVVCLSAAAMLSVAFVPPLMLSMVTAIYCLGTAWLALKPGTSAVRSAEIALSVFQIIGLIAFLFFSIRAAMAGIVPFLPPLVLAVIPLILLGGDVNFWLQRERRAKLRVRRHMARMAWGIVVVVRAPLVELVAAGLPFPQPLLLFGPIVAGLLIIYFFHRRYVGRLF